MRQWLKAWMSIGPTPPPRKLTPQEIAAIVDEKIDRKIRNRLPRGILIAARSHLTPTISLD